MASRPRRDPFHAPHGPPRGRPHATTAHLPHPPTPSNPTPSPRAAVRALRDIHRPLQLERARCISSAQEVRPDGRGASTPSHEPVRMTLGECWNGPAERRMRVRTPRASREGSALGDGHCIAHLVRAGRQARRRGASWSNGLAGRSALPRGGEVGAGRDRARGARPFEGRWRGRGPPRD
jgi:hypothetical protein